MERFATSWAFYDNNAPDAVSTQFASGCSSLVTFAVKENREGGRRCFLGMLDPSARLLVPKNELTFTTTNLPLQRDVRNDEGFRPFPTRLLGSQKTHKRRDTERLR